MGLAWAEMTWPAADTDNARRLVATATNADPIERHDGTVTYRRRP